MALKEGCYNRIAERNGRIYLFQHEAPLAEGLNPLVFPDIHEYKRFVEQQLMSGGECRVLRVRKTRQRHPEEKQEEKRDIKIMEAPTPDSMKEGEPNWSTTRDFGQAWNADTLREFNDYEWNRLNGTGAGAGSAKKGDTGITAANLKEGVLGKGKQTPAEKQEMRDIKLNIGADALIPEGSLRETRVPETRDAEVQKMIAKTATGGVVRRPPPPPFDGRFEMSGDEMKRMFLKEHPEYHDVEMVRTGVNQQEVVSITPRVEGEGGSGVIGNRGLEGEVAKEDLRTMGGSAMDPARSGIEYLRADRRAALGDADKGDTMSRMFAPSTPQDIWDMAAIQE